MSSAEIQAALAAQEAEVDRLKRQLASSKDAELQSERERLEKALADADASIHREQESLASVQVELARARDHEKAAQKQLLDNEDRQYELEFRQRFEEIAHQQHTQRALLEKYTLLEGSLQERVLLQEAVQEEQRRRQEVRESLVSGLLEQAPHLHGHGGDAAGQGGVSGDPAVGVGMSAADGGGSANLLLLMEQVEVRRKQQQHERQSSRATERKAIIKDRMLNLKAQQATYVKKLALEKDLLVREQASRTTEEVRAGAARTAAEADPQSSPLTVESLEALTRVADSARASAAHAGSSELDFLVRISSREADVSTAATGVGVGSGVGHSLPETELALVAEGDVDIKEVLHAAQSDQEQGPSILSDLNQKLRELESERAWLHGDNGKDWRVLEEHVAAAQRDGSKIRRSTRELRSYRTQFMRTDARVEESAQSSSLHTQSLAVAAELEEEVVQHVLRGIWHETERLRSLLSSRIEFSMVSVAAMAHATDAPKTNRDAYLLDSFRQMKRERRARDLRCAEKDQLPCNSIQSHVSATQGAGQGTASAPRRDRYDSSKPKVVTLSDIVVGDPGGLSKRDFVDYRAAEARFWEASRMQPVNLKAPPKIGGVAAVSIALANRGALCSSQNMLAVGTTKGVLCVWTLPSGNHARVGDTPPGKPLLKSQSQSLHPDDKFPITELHWSLDGSSEIITVDSNHVVRTWALEAKVSTGAPRHSRDLFPADTQDISVCVPALRGQSIRPEDLLRHPDSHSLEEAPSSKRGKKNKGISEATRGPLTAAFHPSMTIMGVQPCVMVASAKGTVVKWNHVLERGTVVYGESCAHTEPSNPNLEPGTLMNSDTDARTVKREFYEFHDCRILLLGFLEHGSLTMITLDDKGHLAIWPYSADHFSGFMWHDPAEISTLDLTLDEFVASPQPAASLFTFTTKEAADSHLVEFGELELKLWGVHPDGRGGSREIYHPTADHNDAPAIHELCRDYDGTLTAHEAQPCSHRRYRGTLKQAVMTTAAAEIAMLVDHSKDDKFRGRGATSGRAAGRKLAVYLFNVNKGLFLTSRVIHEISGVKHEPIFAVSPVFDSTGSDYAYILESHIVHVYSFMTGQKLMEVAAPREGVAVGLSLSADHEFMACAVPESANVPLWRLVRPSHDSGLSAEVAVYASRCSRWRDTPRPYRAAKRYRWDVDESGDAAGTIRQLAVSLVERALADELPELPEARVDAEVDRAEDIDFNLPSYGAIHPSSGFLEAAT